MMRKFKKGDLVSVLDDAVKGKVSAVKGDIVEIETTDGFELEFYANELIHLPQEAITVHLNDDALLKAKKDMTPKKTSAKKYNKKDKDQPPFEVDLHIDKLVKSIKGMTNHDILTFQLNTAKDQLEFAIRKRIPRVVFIHGVGEGVLKLELDYLFSRYDVRTEDANYRKYGVGATEVFIYYNLKS